MNDVIYVLTTVAVFVLLSVLVGLLATRLSRAGEE